MKQPGMEWRKGFPGEKNNMNKGTRTETNIFYARKGTHRLESRDYIDMTLER